MAEQKHEKNIFRYSYSRLKTFKECPRKHHYLYVEQLPEPQNEYTLGGSLFHRCVETILNGEDPEPIYKEWKEYVDKGIITLERDQLEYSISNYFSYYYKDYDTENTMFVEEEFDLQLEDNDYLNGKVDQAYEISGLIGVRDIKTTRSPLKYTFEEVEDNMQLLLYVRPIEEKLNTKVDFIEIDEVRLAKLATEVPLVQRGKPSTDKTALSLVTAELYKEELERQNLLDDPKYARTLEYLEQRGHPLFNRVKVQINNRNILDTNAEEIKELYLGASMDIKYRNKDRSKCFLCPYKSICSHDEQGGDDMTREILINELTR
jgi:CRISPR/Cas system-associated exonuclease Cas4 (RecB family)